MNQPVGLYIILDSSLSETHGHLWLKQQRRLAALMSYSCNTRSFHLRRSIWSLSICRATSGRTLPTKMFWWKECLGCSKHCSRDEIEVMKLWNEDVSILKCLYCSIVALFCLLSSMAIPVWDQYRGLGMLAMSFIYALLTRTGGHWERKMSTNICPSSHIFFYIQIKFTIGSRFNIVILHMVFDLSIHSTQAVYWQ